MTALCSRGESLQAEELANAAGPETFFQNYERMMSSTVNSLSCRSGKADKAETELKAIQNSPINIKPKHFHHSSTSLF